MKPLLESVRALHLELVNYDAQSNQWTFDFGSNDVLIATVWRIVKDDKVLIANVDHGHTFGLSEHLDAEVAVKTLLVNFVISLTVNHVADLYITFETGEELQIFNLSSGYENWDFSFSDGSRFIGQGGGKLVKL